MEGVNKRSAAAFLQHRQLCRKGRPDVTATPTFPASQKGLRNRDAALWEFLCQCIEIYYLYKTFEPFLQVPVWINVTLFLMLILFSVAAEGQLAHGYQMLLERVVKLPYPSPEMQRPTECPKPLKHANKSQRPPCMSLPSPVDTQLVDDSRYCYFIRLLNLFFYQQRSALAQLHGAHFVWGHVDLG